MATPLARQLAAAALGAVLVGQALDSGTALPVEGLPLPQGEKGSSCPQSGSAPPPRTSCASPPGLCRSRVCGRRGGRAGCWWRQQLCSGTAGLAGPRLVCWLRPQGAVSEPASEWDSLAWRHKPGWVGGCPQGTFCGRVRGAGTQACSSRVTQPQPRLPSWRPGTSEVSPPAGARICVLSATCSVLRQGSPGH